MLRPLALLLTMLAVVLAVAAPASADPSSAPGDADYARIDTGGLHTCAVLAAGSVRCWGAGASGQLGLGTTDLAGLGEDEHPHNLGDDEHPGSRPAVDLGGAAVAVTAGSAHSCALLTSAAVRCWGAGDNGRLGTGASADIGDDEDPADGATADLGAGHTAKAISAGGGHTCAILDDDTLRCWGRNDEGQLGLGDQVDRYIGAGAAVPLGGGAKAVSAGGDHTCAIRLDGVLRCWGEGTWGVLGQGNKQRQTSPVSVYLGAGRTAKAVSVGSDHACAILDDDTVRCWGIGSSGELGYGNAQTIGDDELPGGQPAVPIGAGRTAKAIVAEGETSCAELDDGTTRCWGDGSWGQLGNGVVGQIGDTEPASDSAVVAPPAGRTVTATAGSCFMFDDASIRCTGWGLYGTTGSPDPDVDGAILDLVNRPVSQLPAIRFGATGTDLKVRATAWSAPIAVDGTRTVTVELHNAGPQSTTGATVGITLPAGLSLEGADAPAGTSFAGTTWTVDAMTPGAERVLELTVTGEAAGTHPVGAAVLTQAGPADVDSTPGNAASAGEDDGQIADVVVVPGADLAVDFQMGTAPIARSGQRSYSVTVTNTGPATATGVVVHLIPSTSAHSGAWLQTGSATLSQGTNQISGTWNVGTIPAGGSATMTGKLEAMKVGTGPVGAKVDQAAQPDRDAADREDTADVQVIEGADLSITSLYGGTAYLGQPRLVSFELSRGSGSGAIDAGVKLTAPAGLEITGVTGSGVTWNAATGVASVTGLYPGGRTLQVALKGTAPGTHTFGAEVVSASHLDPDSTVGNGLGANEDDDATAAFTVPAPTQTTTPTTTTGTTTGTTTTTRPTTTTQTTPPVTTTAPRFTTPLPSFRMGRAKVTVRRGVATLTVPVTRDTVARVRVDRKAGRKWKRVSSASRSLRAPLGRVKLRRQKAGSYRVTVVVGGSRTTARFRVR